MKALICPSLGPAETLKVAEVEPPAPGQGEVVVDVVYAALNFFDTLIIEGKYQLKPEPPFSPAGEFAGRVAAVGPGVAGFAVGDRVMGSTGYGAAREQIAIAADRLAHVPDGPAARQGGGPVDRLRHDAARAQAARRDEAGRESGWCWARRAASGSRRSRSARRWARGSSPAPRRTTSWSSPAATARPRRSTTRPRISAPASRR